MRTLVPVFLCFLVPGRSQDFGDLARMHVGCFKDDLVSPDLKFKASDSMNTIHLCTEECKNNYYKYAGEFTLFLFALNIKRCISGVLLPVSRIKICRYIERIKKFCVGLQFGRHCSCGSEYGRYGAGNCDVRCEADTNLVCGGRDSNSVYKTGIGKRH